MPKRKQKSIEYYENKIKRLRQKTAKRRRVICDSSTDSEETQDVCYQESHLFETSSPAKAQEIEFEQERDLILEQTSELNPGLVTTQPDETPVKITLPDLDPELLLALDDATEDDPVYGEKIHQSLAQRWIPILKKGLPSDVKTKLINEYPTPDNCRLLKAPTLNLEISAAVVDVVKNRDKSIQTKQDHLENGITAINKAMTLLLLSDDKVQAITILPDGCRLLADLHYIETQLRTKLITPCLQKSVLSVIENQERDETLFGVSLSEKIKSSKAIEKQSNQIKKIVRSKSQTQTSSNPSLRTRYQENCQFSVPPLYPSSSRGGGEGNTSGPT